MVLGACGNRFSGGEKEGLNGDTVQQNLFLAIAAAVAAVADLTRRGDRPSFVEQSTVLGTRGQLVGATVEVQLDEIFIQRRSVALRRLK